MSIPYRSGDELDDIREGEAAFWRANFRDPAKGTWWLTGWDKAATEAALLLQGEGHLIKSGRAVREALMAAPVAIRNLTGAKTIAGDRRRGEEAIRLCEAALKLIAEGPPSPAPSDSAARSRPEGAKGTTAPPHTGQRR